MSDDQQQGAFAAMPAGSIFEPLTGEQQDDFGRASSEPVHPDRRPSRGNPRLEQLDVDRGLGKLERICGN